MSLQKFFTPVLRMRAGEDEPHAKHSCTESQEEADLQAEAHAEANYQPPYANEPGSDCESTRLGSTSSLSSS